MTRRDEVNHEYWGILGNIGEYWGTLGDTARHIKELNVSRCDAMKRMKINQEETKITKIPSILSSWLMFRRSDYEREFARDILSADFTYRKPRGVVASVECCGRGRCHRRCQTGRRSGGRGHAGAPA
jgi:hypothetical protein